IDALVTVHRAGAAYSVYWSDEVIPVLSNGFRPPIAAGLTQFMSCEQIEKQLGEFMQREMAEGKTEKYDSHPPLRERVKALESLARGVERSADGPRAVTLLRNLDALEAELVRPMFRDPADAAKLRTLQ